jgi:hypothetical protein
VSVVSDGTNWLIALGPGAFTAPTDVLWTFPGQISTDQDSSIFELKAKRAMTFVGFDADVRVAPTGAAILVDWAVNGIIIPSYQVSIAIGATFGQTLFAAALAVDDTLRPIVSQVGSQTPGQTMVMRARGQ